MKFIKIFLYWLLQLTWGGLMTIIGLIITGITIIFFHGKVHRNGFSYIVEVGGNWGGLELGAVALCGGYTTKCPDENWFQHTRRHEYGHSLQNLIFGPFMLFIVTIPSAIRYHYQKYRSRKGLPNRDYDSIWFEGSATELGERFIDKHEK